MRLGPFCDAAFDRPVHCPGPLGVGAGAAGGAEPCPAGPARPGHAPGRGVRQKFSNVVTEELYVQEITRPREKRTIRSELALVRYPGATQWMMFRDVHEVDGKAVATKRSGNASTSFSGAAGQRG